ncbi:MAG TPA: hypothetical protein VFZ37_08595 [Jiangellaceae bacterium]
MALLPPTDWADVARKDDVAAVRNDVQTVRSDLAALDEKWSTRLESLDDKWSTRLESLDDKWSNRMESLEHRLSSKIDQARAEFYRSQEAQTRLVVFGMITMVVVVAALAFGAARLS